jgi:hypothetical protein
LTFTRSGFSVKVDGGKKSIVDTETATASETHSWIPKATMGLGNSLGNKSDYQ